MFSSPFRDPFQNPFSKEGDVSGFSPTDIVKLWLDWSDASVLYKDAAKAENVSLDGDVIGANEDKAGNGWDATQVTTSEKAIYRTGIQNSLSAGEFSLSWYDFNNPLAPIIPATDDWALYVTLKTGSDVNTIQRLFTQYVPVANNGRLIVRIAGGDVDLFLGSAAGGFASVSKAVSQAVSINTSYIFSLRRVGNAYILRFNGTDVDTFNDTGTRSILQDGNILGAVGTNPYNTNITGKFTGHFFELFFQDGTATTENLENMDTFSNDKWAVY